MELCLGLVANLSRMPMALSDSGKLIYPGSLWPPSPPVFCVVGQAGKKPAVGDTNAIKEYYHPITVKNWSMY